jgi:AraC-like DNA-binding protein
MIKLVVNILLLAVPAWSWLHPTGKQFQMQETAVYKCYSLVGQALRATSAPLAQAINTLPRDADIFSVSADRDQPGASGGGANVATSSVTSNTITTSGMYMIAGTVVVALGIGVFIFRRERKKRKLKSDSRFRNAGEGLPHLADNIAFTTPDAAGVSFTPSYSSTDSSPAILVVEWDEELRILLSNTLRINYRVITVDDGLKGFRKAFDTVPDLVITNSSVPGMDGASLCHLLKTTVATSHIPVIVLETGEMSGQSAAVPHDGCLPIPFDAKDLLISVRNLIDQRRRMYAEFRNQLHHGGPLDSFSPQEVAFIKKLNNYIKSCSQDPRYGPEDLMEQLSMTKIQLFRKIKVLTGRTPGDYLRHHRIEQAKRLLARGESDLRDVAGKAGFSSVSSLTKAFRDSTGKNPADFNVPSKTYTNSMN